MIDDLNLRKWPIREPNLDETFETAKDNLTFTSDINKLSNCEIIYISKDVPTDDSGNSDLREVEKLIELLPINKKKKILQVQKYYQQYANVMIYTYIINIILSGIVINKYSITNQSISTFITYILFIIIKLNNVYSIANTEDFTFYSAYLMTNMQFNDVDKRFKQNVSYDTQTQENTQVMYNMRGIL